MSQKPGQGLVSQPRGACPRLSMTGEKTNDLQSVQFSMCFMPLLCPGLGAQR